jgi:hypothetical protein
MKKYLVITIDVEPDCSKTWQYSTPLTFRGVSKGIGEILQPLFNKYGMCPTYLLNNVVIEDEQSCDILKQLPGKYELGTHLHPEFIEPMKTQHDYSGKRGAANCCEYSAEIEYGKLENITRLFEKQFGYSPTSFRAGRFSAGPSTIDSLASLGYLVDTSVTPNVKWNDKSRINALDYTECPEQPYYVASGKYPERSNEGSILEVPVTISLRRPNMIKELRRSWFGMRRPYRKQVPVWLRPAYATYAQFVKLTEAYIARYNSNKNIVFNMMFHNVEVLPMLSPSSLTQEDCDNYLDSLEKFFEYCNENNIECITLSESVNLYRQPIRMTADGANMLVGLSFFTQSLAAI